MWSCINGLTCLRATGKLTSLSMGASFRYALGVATPETLWSLKCRPLKSRGSTHRPHHRATSDKAL